MLEVGRRIDGTGYDAPEVGEEKAFEMVAAHCAAHRAVSLDVVRSRVGECSHQSLVAPRGQSFGVGGKRLAVTYAWCR